MDVKDIGPSEFAPRENRNGRSEKGKERGGITLVSIVTLLSVGAVIALALWIFPKIQEKIFSSDYFKIESITVVGAVQADHEEIARAIGVRSGESVFETDLSAIRDRIKTIPWVKSVEVVREFPASLIIHIEEYEPVGVVETSEGFFFIDTDGEGALIDENPGEYPRFSGMDELDEYKNAARLLEQLILEELILKDSATRVTYDDVMGYRIHTKSGVEVRFGHPPFEEKIERLQVILPDALRRGPLEYIYLDIDNRVIIKNRID
jgi:cell division septal protein FtsQ